MSETNEATENQNVSPEVEQTEDTQTESQPETTKEQVQSLIKKFKLKVDGQEFEEEIDLGNEAQIIKKLQLAAAAQKRMAEAQDTKRKAYDIIQAFEQDPGSILKRLGDKGYQTAEQILLDKMQQEMMTPEQREMAQMKAELEEFRRAKKEAEEKAEAEKLSALETKYAQEFQDKIMSAVDKSGLPKTPEIAKRMAYLLQKNLEHGLDLDANDLAEQARSEILGVINSITKDAQAEQLLGLLGQDVWKKVDRYRVAELKKKQLGGSPSKSLTQSSYKPRSKDNKPMSWDEWNEQINERLKSQSQFSVDFYLVVPQNSNY